MQMSVIPQTHSVLTNRQARLTAALGRRGTVAGRHFVQRCTAGGGGSVRTLLAKPRNVLERGYGPLHSERR